MKQQPKHKSINIMVSQSFGTQLNFQQTQPDGDVQWETPFPGFHVPIWKVNSRTPDIDMLRIEVLFPRPIIFTTHVKCPTRGIVQPCNAVVNEPVSQRFSTSSK